MAKFLSQIGTSVYVSCIKRNFNSDWANISDVQKEFKKVARLCSKVTMDNIKDDEYVHQIMSQIEVAKKFIEDHKDSLDILQNILKEGNETAKEYAETTNER